MFKDKRDFYLQQIWSRYPVAQMDGVCGRLTKKIPRDIKDNQGPEAEQIFFEFFTEDGKKIFQNLDISAAVWFENNSGPNPAQVLVVGDWIQVWYHQSASGDSITQNYLGTTTKAAKEILLLSPCLTHEPLVVAKQDLYRDWISFLAQVHHFFTSHKFDEIKTPTLVVCPGTEPFLESFATEFKFGKTTEKYFLPTSPELSLKKCLARGWNKIFEIRPCFRNGEKSQLHLSEFYMLEWYRSFTNLEIIKSDICALLNYLQFPGWEPAKLITLSMAELFKKYLQFELTPTTTAKELLVLVEELNLNANSNWDYDDIFFLLYVEKIEPKLHEFEFLILEKYPPSQAALARLSPEGWGERFEFYIKGIEIANAFHELNDPHLQRQRFLEDLEKKRKHGKSEIPLDEDFLLHLEQGMPPAAGIAMGLERLFMSINEIQDINQISAY